MVSDVVIALNRPYAAVYAMKLHASFFSPAENTTDGVIATKSTSMREGIIARLSEDIVIVSAYLGMSSIIFVRVALMPSGYRITFIAPTVSSQIKCRFSQINRQILQQSTQLETD